MKKYLSLNFRADWFEAIEAFPEESQLNAYRAVMRYAFYGEVPSEPLIKMAIGLMMLLIDKRRATRKPNEATMPGQDAKTLVRSAECADIPEETPRPVDSEAAASNDEKTAGEYNHIRQNSASVMKPAVVKSIPEHTVVRDVRRILRAVCRSNLSDEVEEL